jgi:hypothetical protein
MANEKKVTFEDLFPESEEFTAGGHKYAVLPLVLTDAVKYGKEMLWAYNSMAYITDPDEPMRERTAYWLNKAVRNEKGEPVTLEVVETAWTTKELRKCLALIGERSG